MLQNRYPDKHSRLVSRIVVLLTEKGYQNIKSVLSDSESPEKIVWQSSGNGYLPDVSVRAEEFRFFSAETADSIQDEDTADKLKLFSAYAETNGALFYVVFPKGDAVPVRARIEELGGEICLWEV